MNRHPLSRSPLFASVVLRAVCKCVALLALACASSSQAATYTADLQKIYVEYYGRPADPTGLSYWESVVESAVAGGGTPENVLASVANSFGTSGEFTSTMTGLNDDQKVTKLYQNLFSHDPDPSGLLYWSGQLSSGALSLAQLVRAVGESALTAGNTDGVTLQNRITAATAFTDALDTTPEILGYSGATAGTRAKTWLATITNNASRDAALVPATLDATISGVIAVDPAPSLSSISLTSATGAQNDTLNAGDVVTVTVTMSTATTVTSHPIYGMRLALDIGGTSVLADYASGSGTTSLVFNYTIQAGQTDANGISIPANSFTADLRLQLGNGTLSNTTGNATLTHAAVGDNPLFKVDTTAPTISIDPPSVSNTSTGPVSFLVSYADANFDVSNLSDKDIRLTQSGTANGMVAVTGEGTSRTVTISSITGEGALGFSIGSGSASDAAGNVAPAAISSTFVVDNTPPTITISPPSETSTVAGPVSYTVTYGDSAFSASNLNSEYITLNRTGTANGMVAVTGLGTTWTVTISSITGEGSIGFSIAAGTAMDVAGNFALASGPSTTFSVAAPTPSALETLQAYLKAGNTGAGDQFGRSVAISGNTAVVGAPLEDKGFTGVNGTGSPPAALDSGAAYVFVRSGSTWTQQAYLKASNTGGGVIYDPGKGFPGPAAAGDQFGAAVAISGDTIVVGAPFESSNATGVNAALDAVGPVKSGTQADNSAGESGAVYVFTRSGGTWTQQAYLKAHNTGAADHFGASVSVSGDTVVVGALHEDSSSTGVNGVSNELAVDSGAAYVFVRSGTTWSQQAFLKASNAGGMAELSDPPSILYGDLFGYSVAVSGDTIVVGAAGEASGNPGNQADNSAGNAGAAYVFTRSGTTWTQQAYLKASNPQIMAGFGASVAISDNTVVVGATGESSSATGVNAPLTGGTGTQQDNSATFAGAAYVFVRSGGAWSRQAYLKASNTDAFDLFGSSVSISGDSVVVGAYAEASTATGVNGNQSDNSSNSTGAAYVFVRSGSSWSQQAYLKASNSGAYDAFGMSVAVSGGTLIAGAPFEQSNATGVNAPLTGESGSQADNSASSAGAAYVVIGVGPVPTGSPVNTAPTLGAIAVSGTEDTTLTFTKGNFTGPFSDDQGDTLQSITIATLPTTGSLKLSNVTVTANQTISAANLDSGLLTYVPAANDNGARTFTVTASDGSLSSGAATVTMTLAAVNDAPVASGSATLAAINQDTTNPSGATVSSLFSANLSDTADQVTGGSTANTLGGIAISSYTVNPSKGNWQYSTNSGTSWTTLTNTTTAGAITLNATDRLRFLPAANASGLATALSVNLIESGQTITSGAEVNLTGATGGGDASLSGSGGTFPYDQPRADADSAGDGVAGWNHYGGVDQRAGQPPR